MGTGGHGEGCVGGRHGRPRAHAAPVPSRDNAWWWVPVVAPLLGAAMGTALYQLLVAFHHPAEDGGGGARGAKRDNSSTAIPLGAGPWDK